MRKSLLVFLCLIFSIAHFSTAGKYYWVGNGGRWTDAATHWAKSSGGTIMHTLIPGSNDTVYFDANSFTLSGQSVQLDTLIAEIAMMDWSGIDENVLFYSGMSDTLRIHGSCVLSGNLNFNLSGFLEMVSPSPTVTFLNPAGRVFQCDVKIAADSVVLLGPLNLPYKQLNVTDGSINTNGQNVICLHFNTDSTLQQSIAVLNPIWYSTDTLTIKGSIALSNNLGFYHTGPVILTSALSDSNYINIYNNIIPGDLILKGTKKMFLLSPLMIQGNLDFAGGGEFYSKGYAVTAATLKSRTAVTRKLDFSTSPITLSAAGNALYLQSQGLNLRTDSATLTFTYTGTDTIRVITGKSTAQTFKEIHWPSARIFVFNSLTTPLATLGSGSYVALARGTMLTATNITAAGDCMDYNYLRAFCSNCPECGEDAVCDTARPVVKTSAPLTLSFLKIRNIRVSGPSITANNSFDEGNNQGWIITEPSAADTLYWIGGSGEWNDPSHWSETSGSYSPGCLPTRNSHVIFDGASFGSPAIITVSGNAYCGKLSWGNTVFNGRVSGKGTLIISGDISLHALSNFELAGGLQLQSNSGGPHTLQNNGATFNCDISISGSQEWKCSDSLVMDGILTLTKGTLNLNGKHLWCSALLSGGSQPRTLDYSNSLIFLTGADTVWRTTGDSLTLTDIASGIRMTGTGAGYQLMDAGNRSFKLLDILCPKARIANGMNCKLIRITPGSQLECEPGKVLKFDSLVASGLCDQPITLSTFSGSSDSAIFRQNIAGDSLGLDHVILRDLVADTTGGRKYYAHNSQGLGNVSGWNLTSSDTTRTFYWTGLNSALWHDPGNWEINHIPAVCLPGIMDTVVFDRAHLSVAAAHDTVILSRNGYCRTMIWQDSITGNPSLLLGGDLVCSGSVLLGDSLSVSYTAGYSASSPDAPVIAFTPQNKSIVFDPSCKKLSVNIAIQALNLTDTVRLTAPLHMDTLNAFTVYSGTFCSEQQDLYAGIISTNSNHKKRLNLEKSDVTAAYAFIMQGNPILNLNMDSSRLVLDDNFLFYNKFNGGSHRYHEVEFRSRPTGYSQLFYRAEIESSDTVGLLQINPGVHLQIKSLSTLIFDSISLYGECHDSIYINTSIAGSNAMLTQSGGDSIMGICLNIKNITATHGASAIFSRNLGGNAGWFFSNAKLSTASFSLPSTTCYGDTVHFTNTTSALSGNLNDLAFVWAFGDADSSDVFEPDHLFQHNTTYSVSLLSVDTASGCTDLFRDTVTIYRPDVHLGTSENDLTLCLGDTVRFYASTSNPSPFYQYCIAGDTTASSVDSLYSTNSLSHGDEVFVILTYQGCSDTSNHYTFSVNNLPVISLAADEADHAICEGDTIQLTASGANQYQLYINGSSFGPAGATSEWVIPDAVDGDVYTLSGTNTLTGCKNNSTDTITMTVYPLPVVLLSSSEPDLTICSGNQVDFTTTGGALYQYFINGDSLGVPSLSGTLSLTSLEDGDVISVAATSANGCVALSGTYLEFDVAPTPTITLSSSDADNNICQGASVTFTATGGNLYQFSVNGDTTGAFSNADQFITTTLSNNQVITVTGLLGNCPAQADSSITMEVRPQISWTWSDNEICAYDTIHFNASGDTLYQYFIDGIPTGPAGSNPSFDATGLANGQQITVGGTPGACVPAALNVTVHPVPVAPMSCSDPDTAICTGTSVTFTGSGAFQYQFVVDGDTVGPYGFFDTYVTDSLTDGQTIGMNVISSMGCKGTSADLYTMTVRPYPVVTMVQDDPDLTICNGDTVTFEAGGADLYEFFVNGASQGAPGTDSLFATSGLTNGAHIVVQGTTGFCTAPSADAYTFVVHPIPVVTFAAMTPLSYCSGDTLILSAGGASTYEYFVDGVSTGAPTLNNIFTSGSLVSGQTVSVVGDRFGCTAAGNNMYTVTVNNYPTLAFSVNQTDPDICYGDTLIFTGTGAQDYLFYLDGIPVSDDSVFTTADLEAGQTVVLTGGNGACWTQADTTFNLNVHYLDLSLTCSAPAAAVCDGEAVTFNAAGADLYEFFIDGISQGTPSSNSSFTPATVHDGQVVSVSGTSTLTGCTQNATGNVVIHVYPTPELPSLTAICEGDSTLLTSSVPGPLIWYHDGMTFNQTADSGIYISEPGNYQVAWSAGGDSICLSAGSNFYGQLGDSSMMNSLTFTGTGNLENITDVACGEDFTLALLSNGTVKGWGKNEFGSLGTGNFTNAPAPVSTGAISNAVKIAAGMRHGLALLQDSTVVAWGDNTFGQLGLGNFFTSNFPFPVHGLEKVVDIAAGDNFCLAVTSDGQVWAWGQNQYGQLGDGTNLTRSLPVLVTGLDQVKAVRAGSNHSLALRTDGTLWVWGANNAGQLGNGTYTGSLHPQKVNHPLNILSFDGGAAHTIMADTAGHVYCWGDNQYGQTGETGAVVSLYPFKLREAGSAIMVRAGKFSSYALRTDCNVYSWGLNTSGQLGQEHINPVDQPAAVPGLFAITALDAGYTHVAAVAGSTHSCLSNTVNLQVDTVPAISLYLQGTTLYTTTSGDAYQWYHNGNPIPGATDSTLLIGSQGTYAVMVSFPNGCSGMSEPYEYQLGIQENSGDGTLTLYPNPSHGVFTLQFNDRDQAGKVTLIRIMDNQGRLVYNALPNVNSGTFVIDLSTVAKGIYQMEIQFDHQQALHKSIVIN